VDRGIGLTEWKLAVVGRIVAVATVATVGPCISLAAVAEPEHTEAAAGPSELAVDRLAVAQITWPTVLAVEQLFTTIEEQTEQLASLSLAEMAGIFWELVVP